MLKQIKHLLTCGVTAALLSVSISGMTLIAMAASVESVPGDLNGDAFVNTTDVVSLRRYIAGGYGISLSEDKADLNADGFVNTTDVVTLRRYIAGGYGVELKPSQQCQHEIVVDPAKAPTCNEMGLTEGSHCGKCGTVFVAQQVLPLTDHTGTVSYIDATWDSGRQEIVACTACGQTVKTELSAPYSETQYGYQAFSAHLHGAAMQLLYYDIYLLCEEVQQSKQNYTDMKVGEFTYTQYGLSEEEAVALWKIFYMENPKYYWMANTVWITGKRLEVHMDTAYAAYADRARYQADIRDMTLECEELLDAAITELDQVKIIHDFIVDRIEYAYLPGTKDPQTAIWAHNMIGVSSMGEGVCEAYAKTFLYLCEWNGLDCIIVDGVSSGEDHAWNMVCIDGEWYYMDLTWNDSGNHYGYLGKLAETFETGHTKHTSSGTALNYLYDLPKASAWEIQMVTLYRGEECMGLYTNIDATFAAMTDPEAEYTVELFDYYTGSKNLYGALVAEFTTVHDIQTTATPNVKKITVIGHHYELGDGYFGTTALWLPQSFLLCSDLDIENLVVKAEYLGAILDLNVYTLKTGGFYCQFNENLSIRDQKMESDMVSLLINTNYVTEIYGVVELYSIQKISCIGGEILLRNHATIQILTTDAVRIVPYSGSKLNITIENLTLTRLRDASSGMVVEECNLNIGNIICENESYIFYDFLSVNDMPQLKFYGKTDRQGQKFQMVFREKIRDVHGEVFTVTDPECFDVLNECLVLIGSDGFWYRYGNILQRLDHGAVILMKTTE